MVFQCCVYGCGTYQTPDIQMYKFPIHDERRMTIWKAVVDRSDGWKPTNSSRICSKHFAKSNQKIRKGCSQTDDPYSHNSTILITKHSEKSTQTQADRNSNALKIRLESKRKKIKKLRVDNRLQAMKIRALEKKLKWKQNECTGLQVVQNRLWSAAEKCVILKSILMRLIFNVKPFDSALKSFSQSLCFYSKSAHKFVRESFKNLIPHSRTIRKWSSTLKIETGFIVQSLDHIKELSSSTTKETICSLHIDEMSIREQILSNGESYEGFVDFGGLYRPKNLNTPAKNALVVMAVGTNGCWKIPIAFFFTKGLPSRFLSKVVLESLRRLSECNVSCNCVIFDGLPSNVRTAKLLGAKIEAEDPKPYFKHPLKNEKVFIIFDTCHMIKLLRNLWKHFGILKSNGNVIRWVYVKMLTEIQSSEGLKAANRLSVRHVNFEQQKMKVNLATQLFSNSVQNALKFCKDIKIPGFANCGATASFIEQIDRLFDAMNSRNSLAKGYKAPLSRNNRRYWEGNFQKSKRLLLSLQTNEGIPVYETKRKTAIVGLICNMESFRGLMDTYVLLSPPRLSHLLTYKFSQDHIETFFSCIRNVLGRNNNPNVQQFKSALRKVLIARIQPSQNANATPQDETSISLLQPSKYFLSVPSKQITTDSTTTNELEISTELLTQFTSCIVTYIAGWVVHKLQEKIKCLTCRSALENNGVTLNDTDMKLILTKQNGGLIIPSADVIKICKATESVFRRESSEQLSKFRSNFIRSKILAYVVENNVFENLQGHLLEYTFEENHIYDLTKLIVGKYLHLRMHHAAKEMTLANKPTSSRNLHTKLVHFDGV